MESKGSNFKIIVKDEEGKNEEIKRVIELLKVESADHKTILEDLCKLLDSISNKEYLGKQLLEMGFLESAAKILKDEKEYDENIVACLFLGLVIFIIKKIHHKYFKTQEINMLKPKDGVNSLYTFMIKYCGNTISEEAIKLILIIAKKDPSTIVKNYLIEESPSKVLPWNDSFSFENKKNLLMLFEELIKEEIIKKGDSGSEIVEEMMIVGEEIEKEKDIINISEDLISAANDFVMSGKEKGFGDEYSENKNTIISDFLFEGWKELYKEKDYYSDYYSEEEIKKKEMENVKRFCNKVLMKPFDIQSVFIYKLHSILSQESEFSDYLNYFSGRNNGVFLQLFLPLFFKNYHFEESFPLFLESLRINYKRITPCYNYLRKLNDDIIFKIEKEIKEEIEINEGYVAKEMFLWSIKKEEGKNEKEIEYLITYTVKILEWIERIEENYEKEIKEKDVDFIKKEIKVVKGKNGTLNRKEMIMYILLNNTINNLLNYTKEENEMIKKDGRIGKGLLEIVKNHLKVEKDFINSGNRKIIIENAIFSYDEYCATSFLFNNARSSYPFSGKTFLYILESIKFFLLEKVYKELLKKDILYYFVDLLDNSLNKIKIIDDFYKINNSEREESIELDYEILNIIKNKASFDWFSVVNILSPILYIDDISTFDNKNKRIINREINLFFKHSDYSINLNKNEKEMNNTTIEKTILIKPFIMDKDNRTSFISIFLNSFTSLSSYSIFDFYYLSRKSKRDCNILGIYLKELSGEIIDRIVKKDKNDIIKERRRYERERNDGVCLYILISLKDMILYNFRKRNNVYLGYDKNENSYLGKEERIKEAKDYIEDIIEEEDVRGCLLLYLKHIDEKYVENNLKKKDLRLSDLFNNSLEALSCLFCSLTTNK